MSPSAGDALRNTAHRLNSQRKRLFRSDSRLRVMEKETSRPTSVARSSPQMARSQTRSPSNRSTLAYRVACSAALATSLVLGVGCASTQQTPTVVAPQRAAGSVSELQASIRVISDAPHVSLGAQYASALRWAGVEVVPTVADSDVVTELRLTTRRDTSAREFADVSLEIRAGKEHLGSAKVSFPMAPSAPKRDLSVLTAALTESTTVRAYADRVAMEKATKLREADQTAWQRANAQVCAQSPQFDDCREVIRYLNGFPLGEHRAEAEATLAAAELVRQRASRDAAITRVKTDLAAWNAANAAACEVPDSPTACDGVSAYLAAFPQGRFAPQATALLTQSQPKLTELRETAGLQNEIAARRAKVTARR